MLSLLNMLFYYILVRQHFFFQFALRFQKYGEWCDTRIPQATQWESAVGPQGVITRTVLDDIDIWGPRDAEAKHFNRWGDINQQMRHRSIRFRHNHLHKMSAAHSYSEYLYFRRGASFSSEWIPHRHAVW